VSADLYSRAVADRQFDEPDVLHCRTCDNPMSPGERVIDDECESCQLNATSEPGETSDVERYLIPRGSDERC
jgi:hypothetical protein